MTCLVETRYGVMEFLEGDSVVSRSLELYGEWAQDEIALMGRLVRPGDVVMDVGAFLGTHTLALARLVGPGGRVHGFEPRHAIRSVLAGNVERNSLSQVQVHGCALGEQQTELRIEAIDTEDARNFGGLAIEQLAAEAKVAVETIVVKTLDQFGFDRIDMLKIDAEGMEAAVLTGGRQTLLAHQPWVFAECNDLRGGTQTWSILRELGYLVFGVVTSAFSPNNFKGEKRNIFGEAAEVSLLAAPQRHVAQIAQLREACVLAEIDSLDALALLLLHKPQYVDEVWAHLRAAEVLGLDFLTPASRKLQARLDEASTLNAKLDEAATLQARAAGEAAEELAELRRACRQLRADNQALKSYLPSSLLYRWQRLRQSFR